MRVSCIVLFLGAFVLSTGTVSAVEKLELPINPKCNQAQIDRKGLNSNQTGCTAITRSAWDWKYAPINRELLEAKFKHHKIEYLTYHHQALFGESIETALKTGRQSEINQAKKEVRRKAELRLRAKGIREQVTNINGGNCANGECHFKKFGDIAYHYIVDQYGNIAEGRSLDYAPGTYTKSYGTNKIHDFKNHLAVMILGNFDAQELTREGKLALIRVLSAGQRKYKIETKNIQPHKHHANSSCPGVNILSLRGKNAIPEMTLLYSLQSELIDRGCKPQAVSQHVFLDGKYGTMTETALLRLQADNPSLNYEIVSDQMLMSLLENPQYRCK
ncbi:hypothetical protein BKI51_02655 [Alphaproteobacteria bacterium AO1-B]|nr:hypothetical protein BKI51_02655 [Alphaproteobacteria bacterium AO1-B]